MEIKSVSHVDVNFEVRLTLSEEEARALQAICCYGPDQFVKWFYKNLGKAYLQPHEKAMRSLFESATKNLGQQLYKIDNMKKAIKENR